MIGIETIKPAVVVRDVAVRLDSQLSLKQSRQHVLLPATTRLGQIRRRTGREATT